MKKTLVISLFFINLAVTLVFWWLGSSSLLFSGTTSSIIISLGRLAGLIAELFILVQLALVSRAPFIEKVFGFDKLNKLHRTIGRYLTFAILLHPTLLIVGYSISSNTSLFAQFMDFITNWHDVFNAFLGILVLIFAGTLSFSFIRKRLKYEVWHGSHLFMYLAIVLFFGHQLNTADVSFGAGFYYWYALNFAVFGIVLFYRFFYPFVLYHRHKFFIEKIIPETHNVTSVYIGGKNMDKFTFDPGQYISVNFLNKKMWEPHPFSLSQAPNGKNLRLSIKNSGDFTSKIPTLTPGTKVFLEGPLGKFTERASKRDKYLFIAGGIGITPIRSLIESLSKKDKDIVLLYANRTTTDIVFEKELEQMKHVSYYILSNATDPGFEQGYVNEEKIRRLVPDFLEREIYICGPTPMMNSLISFFKKAGAHRSQIHYEIFGY